jgi:hypothetical protein
MSESIRVYERTVNRSSNPVVPDEAGLQFKVGGKTLAPPSRCLLGVARLGTVRRCKSEADARL